MKHFLKNNIFLFLLIISIMSVQAGCSMFTQKNGKESVSLQPTEIMEDKTLSAGMKMIFIKGGKFDIGDTFDEGDEDEKPVHRVSVDDFYLSESEVTVGQFREFVKATGYMTEAENGEGMYAWNGSLWISQIGLYWDKPGFSQSDDYPVVGVSWNDAVAFTEWLSKRSGLKYRLPSEAEWEFAAREGGKKIKYSWGNSEPDGSNCNYADSNTSFTWADKNHNDRYINTAPAKSYPPNSLGLYDMNGNVWEWCSDWYDGDYYKNDIKEKPNGPSSGSVKVLRGGSWSSRAWYLRCSYRYRFAPAFRLYLIGFRVARQ